MRTHILKFGSMEISADINANGEVRQVYVHENGKATLQYTLLDRAINYFTNRTRRYVKHTVKEPSLDYLVNFTVQGYITWLKNFITTFGYFEGNTRYYRTYHMYYIDSGNELAVESVQLSPENINAWFFLWDILDRDERISFICLPPADQIKRAVSVFTPGE